MSEPTKIILRNCGVDDLPSAIRAVKYGLTEMPGREAITVEQIPPNRAFFIRKNKASLTVVLDHSNAAPEGRET